MFVYLSKKPRRPIQLKINRFKSNDRSFTKFFIAEFTWTNNSNTTTWWKWIDLNSIMNLLSFISVFTVPLHIWTFKKTPTWFKWHEVWLCYKVKMNRFKFNNENNFKVLCWCIYCKTNPLLDDSGEFNGPNQDVDPLVPICLIQNDFK